MQPSKADNSLDGVASRRSSATAARRGQEDLSQDPGEDATATAYSAGSWRLTVPAAGLIVLAAVAAYHNSFVGVFAYDDQGAIVENQTIRRLWPIWPVFSPPHHGETVGGRPLLNLTLAINYALGGLHVWGYHATNLLIHAAAALLLFGILRRTFLMPALRDRFGAAATPLALASTLIWTVHPLQTESVTYIVQRAESLAGFFYLLTLYCVIRGAGCSGTVPIFAPTMLRMVPEMGLSPSTGAAPVGQAFQPDAASANVRLESLTYPASSPGEKGDSPLSCLLWYAAAVLACLLGTACKEILITAPLLVLLYDRTFLADSFAEAWRRRWRLYVALAATWGLLACLVFSTGLIAHQAELGAPDPWSYARSQPGVILHYLRLSVWPDCLCMSYLWPVANTLGEILPGAVVVGLLLAATLWGLAARTAWSFLGAWFFLILAPTSSFMPLNQLAHEHRMYLSLAAVVVLAVVGGYALWDRLLPRPAGQGGQSPFSPATAQGKAGLCGAKKGTVPGRATLVRWAAPAAVWAAVLLALGSATVARNRDYHSLFAIWEDTVRKSPHNPVARYNLGVALGAAGRSDEAIEQYRQAVQLRPDDADAHYNLGLALAAKGGLDEAIQHYQEALRLRPRSLDAHNNLGLALAAVGRIDEAVAQFHEALRLKPACADAHYNLGLALAGSGRTSEAIPHYQEAVRLKPEDASARNNLGLALAAVGRTAEAIEHYRAALQWKPDDAGVHNNLGIALAAAGKSGEAIEQYREALRWKPDFAEVHYNLGLALVRLGRADEAIEHYGQAVRLKPDFAPAHFNLAGVLANVGRPKEAIEHYDEVLKLAPDSKEALNDLAWLLATREPAEGGEPDRAVRLAQQARELSGRENAPCLDTLAAAYAAADRFADAVLTAERAAQLAASAGQSTLMKNIQRRLELYLAGRPYRQPPHSPRQTAP